MAQAETRQIIYIAGKYHRIPVCMVHTTIKVQLQILLFILETIPCLRTSVNSTDPHSLKHPIPSLYPPPPAPPFVWSIIIITAFRFI